MRADVQEPQLRQYSTDLLVTQQPPAATDHVPRRTDVGCWMNGCKTGGCVKGSYTTDEPPETNIGNPAQPNHVIIKQTLKRRA